MLLLFCGLQDSQRQLSNRKAGQQAGAKGCWRGEVYQSWGGTGLHRWKGMQASREGGRAVLQAKFPKAPM